MWPTLTVATVAHDGRSAVASVSRDFRGRYNPRLKGDDRTLTVNRSYAERFRRM